MGESVAFQSIGGGVELHILIQTNPQMICLARLGLYGQV
jgi:hypothetical protein